jgi:hypothetical protein
MVKRPGDKYCFECARVIPRTAASCVFCGAVQPVIPDASTAHAAPQRPATASGHPASWPWYDHAMIALGGAILALMLFSRHSAPPGGAAPAHASAAAGGGASPAADSGKSEDEAWEATRTWVQRHLQVPADTTFSEDRVISRVGPGKYSVSGSFEAPNTFRVPVRTRFTALVARVDGTWQLESLHSKQ